MRHHRLARDEATAAALYYEQEAPGLGERFLEAYQAAVSQVKTHPKAGRLIEQDIRRQLLTGFPYGVVYRLRGTHIEILAVAHLKRQPSYWSDRS